jgi:ATP-dependent RNA helicase DHX57
LKVCQPRRLAAIGVAQRVAAEYMDDSDNGTEAGIGHHVGYMVRGDVKASNSTRLVFCTYGVLLRRLQSDPTLHSIDYIIFDEVRPMLLKFILSALF